MPSDDRWLTVADVAKLLDMSPQGVRSGFVRVMGDEDIQRTPGEPLRVRLSAVLDILIDRRLRSRRKLGSAPEDPMMDGSGSPALERYRAARAALAELELLERRREYIPVSVFLGLMAPWGDHLRRAGERLERHHGRAAAAILTDALDQCDQVVQKLKDQTHAE